VTSSLLAPAYALTIGSKQWTEQLLLLDVRLEAAPLFDRVTARLPAEAPFDAAVGDPVSLSLDGGEGESAVFSGAVDAIRRGATTIEVTALDGGGTLAAYRPSATYEQATVATVIEALCGDVGVSTGDLEDGPSLAFYAADSSRTALEHVGRLAGWAGALARVNPDGDLDATVVAGADPDLALKYGRELLEFDSTECSTRIESFTVAGESGAGSASADDALRPKRDVFGGSRPSGPDAKNVWTIEPALRTASSAQTASAARLRVYKSSRIRATLRATLVPALRPGSVVDVQELPEGVAAGPFWADSVSHRVTARGAVTRARLWGAGSAFDPSGLLGSLGGALGGLL
jgi:prophage tail gpP-like protein